MLVFQVKKAVLTLVEDVSLIQRRQGLVISFLILFLSILYLNDLVYTNFSLSLDTKIEYNYFFDPFDQSATNWNLVELHAITSAPTTCDE